MLLNKLRAAVLKFIYHDFAKSSCLECTHQESQTYCSSQKLDALHFINKKNYSTSRKKGRDFKVVFVVFMWEGA